VFNPGVMRFIRFVFPHVYIMPWNTFRITVENSVENVDKSQPHAVFIFRYLRWSSFYVNRKEKVSKLSVF